MYLSIYFILVKLLSLIYILTCFSLNLSTDPLVLSWAPWGSQDPSLKTHVPHPCTCTTACFFLHRLCISKHDERAAAEAKAQAVIDEDYKKLGPIK